MESRQTVTEARQRRSPRVAEALLILVSVLLVLALGLPAVKTFLRAQDARVMLTQSRTVELALVTVAAEERAGLRGIADINSPFGLKEGIEERVRALAECEGYLYLLSWDEKNERPAEMMYVEGELVTVYTWSSADGGRWEVYTHEKLFDD